MNSVVITDPSLTRKFCDRGKEKAGPACDSFATNHPITILRMYRATTRPVMWYVTVALAKLGRSVHGAFCKACFRRRRVLQTDV
jgi:hypothetical protein